MSKPTVLILVVLASLEPAACSEGFGVSLCSLYGECVDQADLTSALLKAQSYHQVIIRAKERNKCASLSQVDVNTSVAIRGEMMSMRLNGTVNVHVQGNLTIFDSAIQESEAAASFAVFGTLNLVNCIVTEWGSFLLYSVSGFILIDSTRIFENEAKLLLHLNGSRALLRNSSFSDNQGLIAADSLPNSVSIANCTFLHHTSTLIKVTSNATIFATGCRFENNDGVLFDFTSNNATVLIELSHFSNNSNGGLRLTESVASVSMKSIEWVDNRYPLLWILSRFAGVVQLQNVTAKGQLAAAVVHIYNTGNATECKVSIGNSHFLDSEVHAEIESAGVVFSHSCIMSLSYITIKGVLLIIPAAKKGYGIVTSEQGALMFSNVQISESGGTCVIISYFFSFGTIENVTISNAISGEDAVIWFFNSGVAASGISISGGTYYSNSQIERSKLVYFFSQVSTFSLSHLAVTSSPKFLGAIIGAFTSKMVLSDIRLRRIDGASVITQMKCDLTVRSLECLECSARSFLVGAGRATASFDGGVFRRSTFSNGMFICALEVSVVIFNCSIEAVSTQFVITAFSATVDLNNMQIIDCQVDIILRNIIKSSVRAENVSVRNTTGAVLYAIESSVNCERCIFQDLLSSRDLIKVESSRLFLRSSHFVQITSRSLIAATRYSYISINFTEIETIAVYHPYLSDTVDSEIAIFATSFSRFNGTCISGSRSTVNLIQVRISDGGFIYEPGSIALYHFGGAVRCIDCPLLALIEVCVMRTSADLGGALYCTSSEVASTVVIADSLFQECIANSAGVAYFRNVSFHILNSEFAGSTAEKSGGAIDTMVSFTLKQFIKDSNFHNNSAFEGGAIKWRLAQPTILNTTFFNNTAFYGPEIASYGVSIEMKKMNSSVASGQITNFTFYLLDHYKQQVLTANSQVLVFQSTPKLKFGSLNYKVAEKGEFNIPLIIHAASNSTQSLIGICDMQLNGASAPLEYEEQIFLRDCVIGEIRLNDTCYPCPAGYYSLALNDKECSICPSIAHCPGGNRIIPKKDAWVTSNPSNPVLPCSFSGICIGNETETCAEGYEGLLCEQCSDGWFHFVFSICEKCPHPGLIVLEETAVLALWVVFVIGFVKFRNKFDQMHQLKLVLEHIQMLALLSFVKIRYPFPLEVFLHSMLAIASFGSVTFPAECLGRGFYTRSIAASIIGFLITLAALFEAIKTFMQTRPRENLRTVLVSLCSFVPILSTMSVLPLFSCRSVDSSDEYLSIHISEKCWESDHLTALKYIAIPSLAWNIALSTVVYSILLTSSHIADEYNNKYWDLVVFILKLLTSAAVILQHGLRGSSQLFIGIVLLIIAAVLNSLCIQYKKDRELFVVQFSNFVLLGTYLLALYISEYESKAAGSIITSSLLFLNFVFLIYSLKVIFFGYPASRSSVYEIHRQRNNQSNETLIAPQNSVLSEHGVVISLQERESRLSAIIPDRKSSLEISSN